MSEKNVLAAGLPDSVHGTQLAFREVLSALSRPGRIHTLGGALPVDIVSWILTNVFHQQEFRIVPTADVNTTFALSLSVFLLMIYFSIAVKGLGGWIHELFCAPFGSNPILWPFNFLFNLVEYVSKPLSHSLRLYGNMYAGEIIFLLLWLWAATSLSGAFFGALLGVGWSIFHILIVVLQAYIFMMLTIVYISMAHERH